MSPNQRPSIRLIILRDARIQIKPEFAKTGSGDGAPWSSAPMPRWRTLPPSWSATCGTPNLITGSVKYFTLRRSEHALLESNV